MYNYKVEGHKALNDIDLFLFKRFCTDFYEVWEYPNKYAPIKVERVTDYITDDKVEVEYLRVDLKDNSWLHVRNNKGNLEWY